MVIVCPTVRSRRILTEERCCAGSALSHARRRAGAVTPDASRCVQQHGQNLAESEVLSASPVGLSENVGILPGGYFARLLAMAPIGGKRDA